jgi:hypothetical protein
MAPRTMAGVRTTSMIPTALAAGGYADGYLHSYCTLPDKTQSQQRAADRCRMSFQGARRLKIRIGLSRL